MIFARERTHSVWRILPPPKMRQTRRSRSILSHKHEGRRPRRPPSEPRPQAGRTVPTSPTQPAGADVQEAQAGDAFNHQINGILYIVKPV